jgi:hypothetical protein
MYSCGSSGDERPPADRPSSPFRRLGCIVELAGESDRLFDVGCDHALVPITLTLMNRCRTAYACDSRAALWPRPRAVLPVTGWRIGHARAGGRARRDVSGGR